MELDSIDIKIVNLLQDNSKANTKEIAMRVGLTVTPTYERIKRLEKEGIITKYVALVDHLKLGYGMTVYCQVSLQLHSKDLISRFENAIIRLDEVLECHHVAGNYDYLLKVVVPDIHHYQLFLKNKLSVLPSVGNVRSNIVMSSAKNEIKVPLAAKVGG